MEIKVSEEIKKACPQFAGIAIRATVENTAYSESLWKKIDEFTICYREMYTTDSIKDMVTDSIRGTCIDTYNFFVFFKVNVGIENTVLRLVDQYAEQTSS